ncbi:hybrid sensor histidine kinase/response regulator transcription factor [Aestuariibaculum marinum]|uniref:histidine kinase n=1 Tax=Aestuariibaculum marinum TaxID=2683592 RepID=A0A8J6Q5E9_9FLAO|nr:hybrid sensor histidine kinase/response regulator transcription factor [Aestuariibaculum marinum]MBD0825167.1 response regulator [Aestuariibaculum marinum]
MKKGIITLYITLLSAFGIECQEYYFKHYKVEDGLSHNTILSSIQDKNGFMWFGTKNGLNRFDGYSFKLFQNNPEDSKSIQGNSIGALHEFNNTLWVGTNNGLFCYNERQENFDFIEETNGKSIERIENDMSGNLWFIASSEVHKYNPNTKETHIFSSHDNFHATSIAKSKTNEIWVTSSTKLHKYVKANNSFKTYLLNVKEDSKTPFRITKIFSLNENTLLVGTTNHGVLVFDTNKKKLVKNRLPNLKNSLYVRDFVLNGNEELWIATETGIYIYNLITHHCINLVKDYNTPYSLSDNAIYCLTIDDQGGVWAGSYFGGLNYYTPQYSIFKKYFPNPSQNSISGNAIREIHSDKYGNLWIGTEDAGLNKFNPKTGVFTNYTAKSKGGILSHYNIHGLLPIDDEVWIGSFDHGLDVLDINTDKIKTNFNTGGPNNLLDNFIYSIYKTKTNKIILITGSAIQYFDKKSGDFIPIEGIPKNNFYTTFLEDNKGILWAGTNTSGLFYYNPHTKQGGRYHQENDTQFSLSNNCINGLFQDSKNNIWITTENGLNVLDSAKTKINKFTIKDGFPSNTFYSVLEEHPNKLWITTANGLVAFNPLNGSKKIHKKINGLLSDQFNYNSSYKAPDGTMYFGSVNGLISFNPKNFQTHTNSYKTLITGLQINNQKAIVNAPNSPLKSSITFLDKIQLKPNESSFSLEFAALSFSGPETTEYWYKMEGINDSWISLKNNHKVFFTELPAGSYKFKVKSLNYNSDQTIESPPLEIKILPVFWKSNLAYFIYTILFILSIYLTIRYYHKRNKSINDQKIKELNNIKEKEIYQAKIEFFTNISHEIRTPLTLIKVPLDKLLKQTYSINSEIKDSLSVMEKNTTRLLDLVNQLLDFRKTEAENLKLTFIETNFTSLINNTYQRFSEIIKDKNIDCELNLGSTDVYAYLDAEAIKKVLSNLIENAIKYSQDKIKITLSVSEESVVLKIQNNGELIPSHLFEKIFSPFFRVSESKTQIGTGIGLALAHSLTKLHNGSLTFEVKEKQWNTFILNLPIHQEKEFKIHSNSKDINIIDVSDNLVTDLDNNDNKTKILLIEDDIDLLNYVAKDLSNDYKIFKATNGIDALKIVEDKNIQLIVTDIKIPEMNGFEVCKTIKSSIETSHIPVIMLTSKDALNSKIEGLESGADAYIPKPFSLPHLRTQINNLIENRNNILAYYASSPLAHFRSIAHSKADETFIDKLDEIISQHISNPDFNVDTLCDIMNMSRSTLYRKIKEMSNLSPNELINISRLKKGAELLKKGNYKIYEVSEMVGYNSQTSFGRNFQKQFNMTPSEYINSQL